MNQKKSGASCAEETKFKFLQRGALYFLVYALILVVGVAWCVNLTLSMSRRTKVHSVSTAQVPTVDDEATTIFKSWVDRDRHDVAPTKTLKKEIRVKSSRDLPDIFDPIEKEYMQQQKKLAGTIKGTMSAQHTKDLNTWTVEVKVTLEQCDKKGQHCKEFASASTA